ncbi:heterokaryon incompatibility protein-domain-containing protein [Dendryphion nanum]|uniref:Heterokaryon incompatibility protein-domain-containing protein n=1 Tax=Dendryphion nanum TaxID=256645 RepID=A0A9P9D4W7_9PLEO|nr:heterokaryon incompatibility protein-domain-containing protein [Dendryphion nanum]
MANELRLCRKCNTFNARALLIAAEAQKPRDKNQNNKAGLPRFFEHVPDLPSLRKNASDCGMCNAIWQEYCKMMGGGEPDEEALRSELSMQSIWIGTTPHTGSLHGLPHVVAAQYAENGQSRILAYFEICGERGKQPLDNAHLLASSIFDNSGSPEALSLCKKWLHDCQENHDDCKKLNIKSLARLPTRVIEVDAKDQQGNPRPRLIDGQDRSEAFAALSYCWGGESILTLTVKTEAELRSGLAMERFPATLREAIVITQHLKIRYLWIDALCIQQDSVDDWTREATKMRDVYKGAVVTIAAASSAKSSDGIFRERKSISAHCRIPWYNGEHPYPTVFLRSGSEIWDDPTQSSTMHTRGWTLQETLLAPRTVYFGAQLLTFECANGQVDEAGRSLKATENYRSKSHIQTMYADISLKPVYKAFRTVGIPHIMNLYYPSLPRMFTESGKAMGQYHMHGLATFKRLLGAHSFFMQGLLQTPGGDDLTYYDLWREIVMEFSTRRLTKSTDTLPALSGLANDFHHVTGDEYVAGMWMGDLMRGLCYTLLLKKDPDSDSEREYLAPSWSWASLHGYQVRFHGSASTLHTDFHNIATIVDIKVTPKEDRFSKVIDGQLTLKTMVLSVPDPREPAPADLAIPGLYERIEIDVTKEEEFGRKHVAHDGQRFILAKLASYKSRHYEETGTALLLESVGDGRWRRVGFISVRMVTTSTDFLGRDQSEIMRMDEWKKATWKKETIRII